MEYVPVSSLLIMRAGGFCYHNRPAYRRPRRHARKNARQTD